MFQSTPVIANGRITDAHPDFAEIMVFQSTPVIANGRISALSAANRERAKGFNPRPLLLTGESTRKC